MLHDAQVVLKSLHCIMGHLQTWITWNNQDWRLRWIIYTFILLTVLSCCISYSFHAKYADCSCRISLCPTQRNSDKIENVAGIRQECTHTHTQESSNHSFVALISFKTPHTVWSLSCWQNENHFECHVIFLKKINVFCKMDILKNNVQNQALDCISCPNHI